MREQKITGTSYADTEETKQPRGAVMLKTFLKQTAAVLTVITAVLFTERSGFTFGKNCIGALGRAVRYEFDWGAVCEKAVGCAASVWRFLSEIL